MPIITKKTGNYSIPDSADDEVIVYESGSYTVILPYAKGTGRRLSIINIGTGQITVRPQPLETIQAASEFMLIQGDTLDLSDLENQHWFVR